MDTKRNSKENTRIKKIKWPKKRYNHINPITRLWLVSLGKKDSKTYTHNMPIFPFVEYEKSKIEKYESKAAYLLEKNTLSLMIRFDKKIVSIEKQLHIVNQLLTRLKGKPYAEEIVLSDNSNLSDDIKKMLEVKRKSEEQLEEKAIRIRRFKEYQQTLEPIRKNLSDEIQKLHIAYNELCQYASNLEGVYGQANMLVKQYITYINMRIALYRRGWLVNAVQGANLPELIDTANFGKLTSKIQAKMDKIEADINEIMTEYEQLMK